MNKLLQGEEADYSDDWEEADDIQESTDSLEEKFESVQELADRELKAREKIFGRSLINN